MSGEEFTNMFKIKRPKKPKVDFVDNAESVIDILGSSITETQSFGGSDPIAFGTTENNTEYSRVNQTLEHKLFYKSSRLDKYFDTLFSMFNDGYEDYEIVSIFRGGSVVSLGMSNILKKPINILQYSTYDSNDKEPKWLHIDKSFEGKNIIICEDIVDTYGTLDAVIPFLQKIYNPASIQVVALVVDIYNKKYDKYQKDGITITNDIDKVKNAWYVFPWEFDHFE